MEPYVKKTDGIRVDAAFISNIERLPRLLPSDPFEFDLTMDDGAKCIVSRHDLVLSGATVGDVIITTARRTSYLCRRDQFEVDYEPWDPKKHGGPGTQSKLKKDVA